MTYTFGQSRGALRQERLAAEAAAQELAATRELLERTLAQGAEAQELAEALALARAARDRALEELAAVPMAEASREWALRTFGEDPRVGRARLELATAEREAFMNRRGVLTAEQDGRIAQAFRGGQSRASLAEEYGVSYEVIREATKRRLARARRRPVGVSPVRDVPRPSQGHAA